MAEPFVVSKHALERALDMGVTGEEIRAAWDKPRNTHRSGKTGCWYLTRGRIVPVVRDSIPQATVVTVFWAKAADWAADLEFAPMRERPADFSAARAATKARRRNRG